MDRTTRRSLLPALGLLLALALVPGCLEADSKTVLAKDGSGTYEQVSTLHMEKAAAYQKMLLAKARSIGIPDDETEENPFAALDAPALAKELGGRRGISDATGATTEDADKKTRTYTLKLKFKSLLDLYEAGTIEDTTVSLVRLEEEKAWKLTIAHLFDGNDNDPPAGPALDQLLKVRRTLLQSVKAWWDMIAIRRTLTLPSKVMASNGRIAEDGKTVTWALSFQDLADPRKLRQEVTFADAEGLELEPFTLTANDVENAREAYELEREERAAAGKKK
jgi:hypothetical protein